MQKLNLALACIISFLLAGLFFYVILWHPEGIQRVIGSTLIVYQSFWGKVLFVSLGFICLGNGLSLLALVLGLDPASRPHVLVQQEGGAVGVSLDAIDAFIKRKAKSIEGVRDIHVKTRLDEDGLFLQSKLTLELHRNVPAFLQDFQSRMHHELKETLGITKINEIQVLIHKIIPRETSHEGKLLGAPAPVLLKESQDTVPSSIEAESVPESNSMEEPETVEPETTEPVPSHEDKA